MIIDTLRAGMEDGKVTIHSTGLGRDEYHPFTSPEDAERWLQADLLTQIETRFPLDTPIPVIIFKQLRFTVKVTNQEGVVYEESDR